MKATGAFGLALLAFLVFLMLGALPRGSTPPAEDSAASATPTPTSRPTAKPVVTAVPTPQTKLALAEVPRIAKLRIPKPRVKRPPRATASRTSTSTLFGAVATPSATPSPTRIVATPTPYVEPVRTAVPKQPTATPAPFDDGGKQSGGEFDFGGSSP